MSDLQPFGNAHPLASGNKSCHCRFCMDMYYTYGSKAYEKCGIYIMLYICVYLYKYIFIHIYIYICRESKGISKTAWTWATESSIKYQQIVPEDVMAPVAQLPSGPKMRNMMQRPWGNLTTFVLHLTGTHRNFPKKQDDLENIITICQLTTS